MALFVTAFDAVPGPLAKLAIFPRSYGPGKEVGGQRSGVSVDNSDL